MVTYKEDVFIEKDQLAHLYNSVGWTLYTNDLDQLEKAINNSLTVITAWESNTLIGLIRVVGDGFTIVYIQDILVHSEYQNKKIGTQLMNRVLKKYKKVRQKILLTEDAPDVRRFYEKFDFVSCDKGSLVAFYKEY